MTAQVVPLVFQQKNSVRVILINNEPWFVATDIAVVLEYSEAAKLTRMLEADEKGLHNVETPGGNQQLSIISQPGLFRALANSRSSKAKPFQRWLFHEALPAIYSTGRYEVPQPDPDPTPTLSLEQWRVISDLIHRISICCKFHGRANSAAHERIRFSFGLRLSSDLHPQDFDAAKADLEGLRELAEQHLHRLCTLDDEFITAVIRPPVSIRKVRAMAKKAVSQPLSF